MFTVKLDLDYLSDYLWNVLEDQSDTNGSHQVEFWGETEQEAWDKVSLAFLALARKVQMKMQKEH